MIGMILTGHGKFAPGMMDVVTLIAGEQKACEVVEFVPTDSIEELTEKMTAAWDRLEASCDGVVVFTDIPGGSPFNVAMRQKMLRGGGCEVIGGSNAPMLLVAAMSHEDAESAAELAEEALEAGKEQQFIFVPPVMDDDDDEMDED